MPVNRTRKRWISGQARSVGSGEWNSNTVERPDISNVRGVVILIGTACIESSRSRFNYPVRSGKRRFRLEVSRNSIDIALEGRSAILCKSRGILSNRYIGSITASQPRKAFQNG